LFADLQILVRKLRVFVVIAVEVFNSKVINIENVLRLFLKLRSPANKFLLNIIPIVFQI